MAKGKLIVLEGLDGSGKYTQFELLRKQLSKGRTVKTLDFPQYDTYFGKQLARYLRGEFGSLDKLPVEVPIVLYALDRYQSLDKLQSWLKKGYIVLLNRYTSSSLAFQGAKVKDKKALIGWIEMLESRLPAADLVIFLDVPRKHAEKLVLKKSTRGYLKGGKRDIHERDRRYQREVEKMYQYLCRTRKSWVRVPCVSRGKLLNKEEIAVKVLKVVQKVVT